MGYIWLNPVEETVLKQDEYPCSTNRNQGIKINPRHQTARSSQSKLARAKAKRCGHLLVML